MPSSVTTAEENKRIVPGAPPPAPLSKSQQKKKRKAGKPKEDGPSADAILDMPTARSAALIDHAPSASEVANGAVEPALVATAQDKEELAQAAPPAASAEPKKLSPSVEAVAKRLRALGKKVQRISTYAHLPAEQLNEDQRRTAATLPALELAVKELEEVKKNIESIEADHAKEQAQARIQEEEVVKQRIADAVADAQAASVSTASRILAFIRFSHLISSEPSITTASLSDAERNAVYVASQLLLGESSEQRDAVVSGFFSGAGDIEGVEYARLRQILDDHLAVPEEPVEPPRSPTPVAAEPEPAVEDVGHGLSASASGASSFHFMQASELEGTPFEQGAEWVEKPDEEPAPEATSSAQPEYTPEPEASASAEPAGPIDWANDDGGLPEIESLQAKFGSSGEATPNIAPEAAAADGWAPAEPAVEAYTPPAANGHAAPTTPAVDDDGFTEARRPRTTSTRGGGGDRGFRGRGGFRGGERGGYRGRPDGEFRGRGGFRGGDRGRGEFRGRGRGERGFRGGRGAAPVDS